MNLTVSFKGRLFKIIVIFFILLFLSPIGLYFYEFNGNLSSNPADWGNFGNFFSGTIGVLMMLINIIVIIFLGIMAKNYSINLEERLHKKNLRFNAYKQLLKAYNKTIQELSNLTNEKNETLKKRKKVFQDFRLYCQIFHDTLSFLFNQEIIEKYESFDNVLSNYEEEPAKDIDVFIKTFYQYIFILQQSTM